MFTINRKKHCSTTVGIAVAALAVAHVAAGIILYKNACHHRTTLPRIAKKAKRTVVGLVREFL